LSSPSSSSSSSSSLLPLDDVSSCTEPVSCVSSSGLCNSNDAELISSLRNGFMVFVAAGYLWPLDHPYMCTIHFWGISPRNRDCTLDLQLNLGSEPCEGTTRAIFARVIDTSVYEQNHTLVSDLQSNSKHCIWKSNAIPQDQ
jgi:hypothetical protein